MTIRPGNSKLGPLIHHWSIPAIILSICVGATALCRKLCYAMQGHYNQRNVKEALLRNYEESLRDDFVTLACGWIRALFVRVIRIHASGEFYSTTYVDKWIEIARRNPQVTFYAYTRSWRKEPILERLIELSKLPNVWLWFSCDQESGPPPVVSRVRRAFLMVDDADVPQFPVDLIFRDKDKSTLKWVGPSLVCPAENGVTSTTCSQCQLCFRNQPMPVRRTDGRISMPLPVLSQTLNADCFTGKLPSLAGTKNVNSGRVS